MKRNSTQHSTSGTPPISFAAAAQKNTNKANPPTQPATTTTPATPAANPSSAAAAAAAPAAASQTPSSTATTPSSGSQAAAVNNSSSSSTSTTPSSKPASAKPATSTPATPSTANGNYSAVAAKANHAYCQQKITGTHCCGSRERPARRRQARCDSCCISSVRINQRLDSRISTRSLERRDPCCLCYRGRHDFWKYHHH
ncbi:MAG: hypothetical protein JOS17DRAFT_48068 [Linnemannia elongata]|nr:MAG: hypothetical protein JOS17DRAFT_48068 [Linnemannia elongata]